MNAASNPFSFSARIDPTRLSPAYRLGLVVVAAAMLLLPMLYVGLIGLIGTTVWWHLTHDTWILAGRSGRQWRVVLYLTPAIVGVVLAFFMVKPILARPTRRDDAVPVDPAAEPTLFAFIRAICQQVGAPVPRRVEVDCHVNASAGFKRGLFGMWSNDLVLTIGLPLVAGLSVRQLGGVLAHEFGHFAQGGGMRLTGVVRGINAWFARVVYERDDWDQKLEAWSRNTSWQVALVMMIARVAVWVTRKVLNGLMLGAHAVSCFMMRQMEFDADSYEVKIAGSEAFVRTSDRMREMNLGAQLAYADLRESLRRGRLPSDVPAFIVDRSGRIPAELRRDARAADSEHTGWFDTHPCDAERVAAARAAGNRGVLEGGDGPATSLFHRFEALSAAATRLHYEQDLGISLGPITLVDTDAAIRQSIQSEHHWQAVRQLFGDNVSASRPLHLPAAEVSALDEHTLRVLLSAASAAMADASVTISERYRQFDALERQRDHVFAAQQLLGAGFSKVVSADAGLTQGTMEEALSIDRRCAEAQQMLTPALRAYETAAARRLLTGIHIGAGRPLSQELTQLIDACNALGGVVDHMRVLRRLDFAFAVLHQNESDCPTPKQLQKQITETGALIASRLDVIRVALSGVACPSVLDSTQITLAERCGFGIGQSASASQVIDRICSVYFEVLGRLSAVALEAEPAETERRRVDAPVLPASV